MKFRLQDGLLAVFTCSCALRAHFSATENALTAGNMCFPRRTTYNRSDLLSLREKMLSQVRAPKKASCSMQHRSSECQEFDATNIPEVKKLGSSGQSNMSDSVTFMSCHESIVLHVPGFSQHIFHYNCTSTAPNRS